MDRERSRHDDPCEFALPRARPDERVVSQPRVCHPTRRQLDDFRPFARTFSLSERAVNYR